MLEMVFALNLSTLVVVVYITHRYVYIRGANSKIHKIKNSVKKEKKFKECEGVPRKETDDF